MDFNIELQNEFVRLRPINKDDYNRFLSLTGDKSMWTYFTDDLSDKIVLKEWIDNALRQINSKTRLAFAIIDKKHNQIIGSTSFGNISERDKRIEIGWTWLGKEFQGKGFNAQVKYLMLQYCFEELEFERVELKTDVLNTPARKAMLNIGFKEEGVLRSHTLMTNNRRRDTIYYSMLKHEWNDLKRDEKMVRFKSEKVSKSATIKLQGNIENVFRLFGAFEEKKWAEGWNPVLIYPSEEIIEEGTTFETAGYGDEKKYLWRVTRFEKNKHLIQYLVSTKNRYWTITLECRSFNKYLTEAQVTYTYIGLNEKGNSLNKQSIQQMFSKNLNDWEEAINQYLNNTKFSKQ